LAIEQFKELNTDIKLKLLSGEPIEVTSVGLVSPLTLRQIARIGYLEYITHLNLFVIDKKDFIQEEFIEEVDLPLFSMMIAFADQDFLDYMTKAFSIFLNVKLIALKEHLMLVSEDPHLNIQITSDNFDDLRQVIQWQNGINDRTASQEIKFKNDRAKLILEKLQKAQAEVDKQKRKENSDLDFADIISAIASKSFSLNKLNVFDLTVYQMYDEFRRLDLIDNYGVAVQAMMQGAKNIDLKHWTTKISE
jgi:hypothetical protein